MNVLASRGQLRASFIRWALVCVPAVVLLGFLSGNLGGGPDSAWFSSLTKPALFPPPALFGIVWTILYIMIGIALALVCAAWGARGRTVALVLFAVQFALNLAWTPVFFGAHQLTGALAVIVVLDILVILTIAAFWKVRVLAGALMLPYLAWIMFATVLNYQFLVQNPDADGQSTSNAVQRIAI